MFRVHFNGPNLLVAVRQFSETLDRLSLLWEQPTLTLFPGLGVYLERSCP